MTKLFAGLDISTQSAKLIVIDFDAGEITYRDKIDFDTDLPKYNTLNGVIQNLPAGVSESDPLMWIESVNLLFSRFVKSGAAITSVKSISVSGQQHGLVSLDKQGNLTRSTSKLWNDFSTLEECDILTKKLGGRSGMIKEVGNSQRSGYTAAKIYHLYRNEEAAFKKTSTFFLVHNYLNWYLTDEVRVMEPGDTSGMALRLPAADSWSDKLIDAISPDLRNKLPPVKPSDRSIGLISTSLCKRFGFSPDCTIDAGSGDNMYGAIGTGNVEPGLVTISLGTSGTAYTCMTEPYIDPEGEIASFCDATGNFLPLLCISNMAGGYNKVLTEFNLSHQSFNKVVAQTPAGNLGRLILPWYEGERTPDLPLAAPLYFGFGIGDFTKENLCRGVLEGHILNLYDAFCRLPVKAEEIRLTGGLSQSRAWCQTIADIFEVPTVPVKGEGAGLGAALHAAWVWHKEHDENISISKITNKFVEFDEPARCWPDSQNIPCHRIQKRLYKALTARVRGLKGDDPFVLRDELLKI